MRLLIDYDIKTFDDAKAAKALSLCEGLCEGCERTLEKCLLDSNDCPTKDAVESLSGMIRTGKGIRRYKEIGDL